MKLFPFLAVWGAIVSTIALTWNIIRDIRDKGKLKLNAFIGKMFLDPKDKDYLVVTITNVGRRPIFVKHLGGETKKKTKYPNFVFVPRDLPKMLKEGEYHIEYIEDLSYLSSETTKICANDSTGKEWKISKRNLKRLISEAQERIISG